MTTKLTVKEWQAAYDRADEDNAFSCLCRDWHSGQWSAFYKLQCSDVVDASHASEVAREARKAIAMISTSSNPSQDWKDDYPRLVALLQICEEYPSADDDDYATRRTRIGDDPSELESDD